MESLRNCLINTLRGGFGPVLPTYSGPSMSMSTSSGSKRQPAWGSFVLLAVLLVLILGWLFAPSFRPGWTLFLNDGPLGALKADYNKTPDAFFGVWSDLNWVGAHGGSLLPSFTFGQFLALGPVGFSKFHAPISLLVLGLSVWLACRALGFNSAIATLTGLAAALNMNVFSNACWGLSSRPFALATSFLAIGALGATSATSIWVRCALAGLAVGMGITEGADVGVIFSLFIGAFAFCSVFLKEKPSVGNAVQGFLRLGVVVVFAAFMAYHIIDALVFRAKVLTAAQSQKQVMSPEQQWDWATQWSLPKGETFRLIIPGLHGYRMDTPDGGRYWGTAGRDPQWETTKRGFARFSGAGEYAGVTVVLFAAFAFAQALRRQGGPYSVNERNLVLFWAAVALLSLLFAWGRYAPFYRIVYALPYFSSLRNPIKWTHVLHLATLMLFAYGLLALWRSYLEKPAAKAGASSGWWSKASTFDKRWTYGCAAFLGLSVLGWMIYSTSTGDLVNYLLKNAVAVQGEPETSVAKQVAHFSQREVGLYLLFLVLSLGAMFLGLAGVFQGRNAVWMAVVLGGILAVDLSRANTPWIQHYDYQAKYASNDLLDYLRTQPHHQRVTVAPFGMNELGNLQQIYHVEWMQQQFPFYNIPSIDVIQDPRPTPENITYREKLQRNVIRLWELTSTRYVFALANPFAEQLSQQLDGNQGRFKQLVAFTVFNSGDQRIGVTTNSTGPYALLEFTGALPRASLFTRWQSYTNDDALLNRLGEPSFVPSQEVLISGDLPSSTATNAPAGKAEIISYAPKRLQVKTQSEAPAVLMLTDKYDGDWRVRVDGQTAPLLRCNYLMRGVQVPAGQHTVEFEFQPSTAGLYVSLLAILTGILLCGVLLVTGRNRS